MDIYTTDEEQVEKIKNWLKEYGLTVIISLMIAIGGFFGWRYWRGHQEKIRYQASVHYEQMLFSFMRKDQQQAQLQALDLLNHYQSTPYAKLASLLLAKIAVNEGNYSQAGQRLRWVIHHSRNRAIQQIARNRAARIFVTTNKPEQALKLLERVDDPSYLPVINAIRGDAYLALGNNDKARQAFKAALSALPEHANGWPLLEMKLNALATNYLPSASNKS